jgi:hypothetical protein
MNIPFVHPTDRVLVSVANGEFAAKEQARVSAHLASCQRCRSYVQDVRAMSAESTVTDAPRASDALLGRILAERSAGARVILATDDVPVDAGHRFMSPGVIVSVGIAAAVTILAVSSWRARTRSALVSQTVAKSDRVRNAAAAAASADVTSGFERALSIWPSVANAQAPSASREAPFEPARVAGSSRLSAGTRQYVFSTSISSDSLQLRPGAVVFETIAKTTYQGTPAWRLTTTATDPYLKNVRSSLLRGSDLRLLESRWDRGLYVQTIRATDSSVTVQFVPRPGAYTFPDSGIAQRSGTFPIQAGHLLVIGDAGLRLLLQAISLNPAWRGSVDVIRNQTPLITHIRPMYVNLSVAGQVRVWVASSTGRVLCWRVRVDAGGTPEYWFVSRNSGEVIRIERTNDDGPREEIDLMNWRR